MRSIRGIEIGLKKYHDYLERVEDVRNESVSGWSLYQQIEHVLVTNLKIFSLIADESAWTDEPKPKTLLGRVLLTFGVMPRGKAKAPEFVQPADLEKQELLALFDKVEKRFELVKEFVKDQETKTQIIGNHPYFGGLKIAGWLRMVDVHQKHHLKIIRDIVR